MKRTAGLAVLVIAIYVVLRMAGGAAGRRAALEQIEADAIRAGAPVGLLGAKWGMSADQVRAVRPRAETRTATGPDLLVEFANVFEREAAIAYDFNEDYLISIVVTFLDLPEPASPETFSQTQALLVERFGPMPEPKPNEESVLESAKNVGDVTIRHLLKDAPPIMPEGRWDGRLVEQVIVYRDS